VPKRLDRSRCHLVWKRGQEVEPPIFGPCLLWPNSWMDHDDTWYGGRPQPRPHCARWGLSSPLQKGGRAPNFRPMSIVPKRLDGSRCHLVRCIVIPVLIYFSIPVYILFLVFQFLFYSSLYLFFSSSFYSIPVSTFFYCISIPVTFFYSISVPDLYEETYKHDTFQSLHCNCVTAGRVLRRPIGRCVAKPLCASQCIPAVK